MSQPFLIHLSHHKNCRAVSPQGERSFAGRSLVHRCAYRKSIIWLDTVWWDGYSRRGSLTGGSAVAKASAFARPLRRTRRRTRGRKNMYSAKRTRFDLAGFRADITGLQRVMTNTRIITIEFVFVNNRRTTPRGASLTSWVLNDRCLHRGRWSRQIRSRADTAATQWCRDSGSRPECG